MKIKGQKRHQQIESGRVKSFFRRSLATVQNHLWQVGGLALLLLSLTTLNWLETAEQWVTQVLATNTTAEFVAIRSDSRKIEQALLTHGSTNQLVAQAQATPTDQTNVNSAGTESPATPATTPAPTMPPTSKLGIHILSPGEIADSVTFFNTLTETESDSDSDSATQTNSPANVLGATIRASDQLEILGNNDTLESAQKPWRFVTVPFTLGDIKKPADWQAFFDQAQAQKIIPLVRLATEFNGIAWEVPSRKEVVQQINALEKLEWPTAQKHVIIYNEVNHAKEWGGRIDPAEYASLLRFATSWAKASDDSFVVLPAAMDLAAPTGAQTMEAFTYLEAMLAAHPDVFNQIDIWNSHSYPNPAFSAPANRTGQQSLRGFTYELDFIAQKTGRKLPVIITETGWIENRQTRPYLRQYYLYALENIWSDPRVLAVTPFLLKGDPGPFATFGFLDRNNQPTSHFSALQAALQSALVEYAL